MADSTTPETDPNATAPSSENQDQLILAQKEAIEKDIADKIPLVGAREPLSALETEFANDPSFLKKVKGLGAQYAHFRRTRPDGNCFFRALGFGYLDLLRTNPDEYRRFKTVLQPAKDEMIALGMPAFTVEDFYDNFVDTVDAIGSGETTAEGLLEIFADQGRSDYLVVFLRLVTSKHLQQNSEFFMNFMEGGKTVAEFCNTEVEPMYNESDHIHISALTEATGISVRVLYLDRGEADEVTSHDFPDGKTPLVHLLYRPGHYDVIYKQDT